VAGGDLDLPGGPVELLLLDEIADVLHLDLGHQRRDADERHDRERDRHAEDGREEAVGEDEARDEPHAVHRGETEGRPRDARSRGPPRGLSFEGQAR